MLSIFTREVGSDGEREGMRKRDRKKFNSDNPIGACTQHAGASVPNLRSHVLETRCNQMA